MTNMKKRPIWLKSILCGLFYLMFSLLLIFAIYIMDFFGSAFILGALFGIIIAVITDCDNLDRAIITKIIAILTVIFTQIVLTASGIPYRIILYIYRNNEFVHDTGRLSINEKVGYGFGIIVFWLLFIASFLVISAGIIINRYISNRKDRKRSTDYQGKT